jgi:hypothetical protein
MYECIIQTYLFPGDLIQEWGRVILPYPPYPGLVIETTGLNTFRVLRVAYSTESKSTTLLCSGLEYEEKYYKDI